MQAITSIVPLSIGSSGCMRTYQVFPAIDGFLLSRRHAPFRRKPTVRECQKLRGFNPCGVSHKRKGATFMIVVMQAHCKDEAIEHVMQFLDAHGLSGHLSQGVERTIIGVLGAVGPTGTRTTAGGINPSISDALEGLPGVEQVLTV